MSTTLPHASSASRLLEASQNGHDLSRTTLHVNLDHDRCMEVMLLRGAHRRTEEVRRLSDQVIAQRGVRPRHHDCKQFAPAASMVKCDLGVA
jgi:metal-responsive CopG/Arc/MetJ family transcriptional regulator